MKTVVVTRQPALVRYLRELGLIDETAVVLEYATVEDVFGNHVYGNLPMWLGSFAYMVTETPLDVPSELRGSKLSIEQVRQHAGKFSTYRISRV